MQSFVSCFTPLSLLSPVSLRGNGSCFTSQKALISLYSNVEGWPSFPSVNGSSYTFTRHAWEKWGSDSGMTRGGGIEKVPATAGSRLISISSAEDGPQAQAAHPGDCMEIILQLLPVQGPCCPANPQAHDQHSVPFSLKTQRLRAVGVHHTSSPGPKHGKKKCWG